MTVQTSVIVYSTPTCPYCTLVKNFLADHNVTYEEKDVAADKEARQEMLSLTGRTAVPALKIGDDVVVGFDRARISELLGL
ncbi:MAG TPA: glutaredoxin family protein [Firmicutes bacterium]|jgi:glutaredoxin 3|nr:glutaredoxin family protein [Bacillota bacterium]